MFPYCFLARASKIDNTINVGAPAFRKINVILPSFSNLALSPASNKEWKSFQNQMKLMLEFTDLFEMKTLSVRPHKEFQVADWNFYQSDFVILGTWNQDSSRHIEIELKTYDIKLQKLILGKRFSNLNEETLNLVLKKYCDDLLYAITGTSGPFMSKIVFAAKTTPKSKYSEIFISDFDGTHLKQITKNNSINLSPSWSPDGLKITYTSFVTGKAEIFQYNLNSKKITQLTKTIGSSSGAAWSPDGKKIAFSTSLGEGKTNIFTMNSYGGDFKKFIEKSEIEVEPAFSPDGKYIAYTSNRFGKPMLFKKNLTNDEDTRMTFSGWYNASPAWSANNQKIAFASYDREIDRWDIFILNNEGNSTERLTLKSGDNEKPSWAPDSRYILFQSTRLENGNDHINSDHRLMIMNQDGTHPRNVFLPVWDPHHPSWSPRLPFGID